MKKGCAIWIVLLVLSYVVAALACSPVAPQLVAASGMYYLSNGSNAVPSPFPSGERGFTNRIAWKTIEPTCDGGSDPTNACFVWTVVDNTFANMPTGTILSLDIQTGVFTPNWALNKYEAGAVGTFSSIWQKPFTPGTQNTTNNPTHNIVDCAIFEFPIPWDTIYQSDLSNMVTALAAHIATLTNKSILVRIWANMITEETGDETYLMGRTSATTLTCGSGVDNAVCGSSPTTCTPPLDTAAWQAAGYTPNKVAAAYQTMIAYYVNAFPSIVVSEDFPDGLFPPIDNSGNPTGGTSDTTIKFTLIADGQAADPYFAFQNNGGAYPLPAYNQFPLSYTGTTLIGYQSVGDNQSNVSSLWTELEGDGVGYYELYPNDSNNSTLAAARAAANLQFQANATQIR